jgi:hypothetical protein
VVKTTGFQPYFLSGGGCSLLLTENLIPAPFPIFKEAMLTGKAFHSRIKQEEKMMIQVQKTTARRMTFMLLIAVLCGCASSSSSKPAKTSERSGFLSNYELLKLIEGDDSAKAWRAQDVDWKKYDKVLIERIQVFIKEDSENKGIDPTDLKMLTDYFYQALVKEIEPTAQIVSTAGPNVIGLRIAIVNLVPTKYGLSIAGTLTPYAFVVEAASGPASGRPAGSTPYLGETGIEAQVQDGVTGQIIAEFADNRFGKKYDVDTSRSTSGMAKQWVNGYVDSFTTWNYAKQSFDLWAGLIKIRFNELRGIKAMK